jgi:hypothetical protein
MAKGNGEECDFPKFWQELKLPSSRTMDDSVEGADMDILAEVKCYAPAVKIQEPECEDS